MKKTFARLAAAVGLAALFTTSAFAQVVPTKPSTAPGTTAVKSHVRHLKSGKTVTVKGYNRPKPGMAMTHVKGYTRKGKGGKIITVKGYNRKPSASKTPMMKKP